MFKLFKSKTDKFGDKTFEPKVLLIRFISFTSVMVCLVYFLVAEEETFFPESAVFLGTNFFSVVIVGMTWFLFWQDYRKAHKMDRIIYLIQLTMRKRMLNNL
jgi:hypothetical protein